MLACMGTSCAAAQLQIVHVVEQQITSDKSPKHCKVYRSHAARRTSYTSKTLMAIHADRTLAAVQIIPRRSRASYHLVCNSNAQLRL